MARRLLLMLMFATLAGFFVGSAWLGNGPVVIVFQHLFSTVNAEYRERCETNQNDLSVRFLPEATQVLAKRNVQKSMYFFIETSCMGAVNARQACAVESAAKLHPEADIYLLLLSPPSPFNLTSNLLLTTLLEHYSNAHVLYVNLNYFFKNSPLEEWYNSGQLQASRFLQSHTSDVFRYYTLWKYGGTYLDLDIVLLRSLQNLKNFACAESDEDIAAGAMNFEPRKSSLALECLKELQYHFRGDDWGNNGPGVITRVMQRVCHEKRTKQMTKQRCKGFTVLPPSAFYPVRWQEWKLYFDEKTSNSTMGKFVNSYAIHVWNKFSATTQVIVGSRQPYGLVAQKFCPLTYRRSGVTF